MLETNRCKLLEIQARDFDDVKQLYLDSEVRKFLGGVIEEKDCLIKFNQMLKLKVDQWHWVIREKQSMVFIGLISLDPHVDGLGKEISYQILPNWWGKGYASESVKSVLEFAFDKINLDVVVAETQSANLQSCKLLERVGMRLENKVIRFGAEQSIYKKGGDFQNKRR